MSLTDLAKALRAQLPESDEGSVTFDASTLEQAAASNTATIIQNLSSYLGITSDKSFTISGLTQADIPEPQDGVLTIVKGATSFLNANMGITRLEFRMPTEEILTLAFQTDNLKSIEGDVWHLSTSFPSFVVFPTLDNDLVKPSFTFSSPDTANWQIDQSPFTLPHGLGFYANLDLRNDVFKKAADFFNFFKIDFTPSFHLFGPIDITNPLTGMLEFPSLDLKSPLLSKNKDQTRKLFDIITIQNPTIGVRLVDIAADEDNPSDVAPDLYMNVEIPIDKEIVLDFSASLSASANFLMFGVTTLKPLTIDLVCSELMGTSKEEWDNLIPAPLKAGLELIDFQGFSTTMTLDSGSFSLNSLRVHVGSTKKISLFPPLDDFEFYATWTMLGETKRFSMTTFGAEVEFDGIGTFDVEISV